VLDSKQFCDASFHTLASGFSVLVQLVLVNPVSVLGVQRPAKLIRAGSDPVSVWRRGIIALVSGPR
jgi:hypothetical protein